MVIVRRLLHSVAFFLWHMKGKGGSSRWHVLVVGSTPRGGAVVSGILKLHVRIVYRNNGKMDAPSASIYGAEGYGRVL